MKCHSHWILVGKLFQSLSVGANGLKQINLISSRLRVVVCRFLHLQRHVLRRNTCTPSKTRGFNKACFLFVGVSNGSGAWEGCRKSSLNSQLPRNLRWGTCVPGYTTDTYTATGVCCISVQPNKSEMQETGEGLRRGNTGILMIAASACARGSRSTRQCRSPSVPQESHAGHPVPSTQC